MKYILLYVASLAAFLIVDFIWLGFIAKNLYQNQIGHLMADKVNFLAAFAFYLFFVFALVVMVIIPGVETKNFLRTLLFSALFGMVSYATYDLTNLATLRDWPIMVTVIDIIWGGTLTSVVGMVGYWVGGKLL